LQNSLRVGKRAHSETRLDQAGPGLIEAGLTSAEALLAADPAAVTAIADAEVLVIGAGAMSGLAVATAQRAGAARITIASRTADKADRLVAGVLAAGGQARALPMDRLTEGLAAADVVLTCAGSTGHLVEIEAAARLRALFNLGPEPAEAVTGLPADLPVAVNPTSLHGLDLTMLSELIDGGER